MQNTDSSIVKRHHRYESDETFPYAVSILEKYKLNLHFRQRERYSCFLIWFLFVLTQTNITEQDTAGNSTDSGLISHFVICKVHWIIAVAESWWQNTILFI